MSVRGRMRKKEEKQERREKVRKKRTKREKKRHIRETGTDNTCKADRQGKSDSHLLHLLTLQFPVIRLDLLQHRFQVGQSHRCGIGKRLHKRQEIWVFVYSSTSCIFLLPARAFRYLLERSEFHHGRILIPCKGQDIKR